jgi:hypothetical protein
MLPNTAITASSVYSPDDAAWRSRLVDGFQGWRALGGDPSPWLEWDFGTFATITKVRTLGQSFGHWIANYTLEYTQDNAHWLKYPFEFSGNEAWDKLRENEVDPPIVGRKVRLRVLRANGQPSGRVELMGCLQEDGQGFIKYEKTNAYDGHGAVALDTDSTALVGVSPSQCKQRLHMTPSVSASRSEALMRSAGRGRPVTLLGGIQWASTTCLMSM